MAVRTNATPAGGHWIVLSLCKLAPLGGDTRLLQVPPVHSSSCNPVASCWCCVCSQGCFCSLNHDGRPLNLLTPAFLAKNKLGHLSNFGAAFLQAKWNKCLNLHVAEKACSKEDSCLVSRFKRLKWPWEQTQHQQEATGLCFHSANWQNMEQPCTSDWQVSKLVHWQKKQVPKKWLFLSMSNEHKIPWGQTQHQQKAAGLCFHSANWEHLEEPCANKGTSDQAFF